MEVLAGVIIGVLVAVAILKQPININIHKKLEEIRPEVSMPDIADELNKAPNKTDIAYEDHMKGFIDGINDIILGGVVDGKERK